MRAASDTIYANARWVVARLQDHGHQAVFAGGCVRDMLLGGRPKDYDIATGAAPEQVQNLFESTRAVGKSFGVILVIVDEHSYEVATFRCESGYSDGRRPDHVHFSDLEHDARRRDFTINAMYFDPLTEELIDTVGGRRDLEKGRLRTVGEPQERFEEDHLRLIRAVRFAARLDFDIESGTKNALRALSHRIEKVAPERLCEELRIILTDRAPAAALRLMDSVGILTVVFPELEAARGCEQPENYHPEGDVFVHTLLAVEKLGPCPDFEVAMATLLHDVGKPQAAAGAENGKFPEHERIGAELTAKICRRLRVTKKETDRIVWLVKRHMYFKDAERMKNSTLKKLFAEEGFEQLCQVAWADAMASWGRTDHVDYVLEKREELSREDCQPVPLIDGHDLLDRGFEPGPLVGDILDHVYDMQLEGDISTREQALEAAEKYAEKNGAGR